MLRDVVKIDDDLCNGCGLCIPACHEGALQIIDGKVRLVSDLMCDGLGACLGHCPTGAISIEKREAVPYNEVKVMEQMVRSGRNTVFAHLMHLKDHDEKEFLQQGVHYLKAHEKNIEFDVSSLITEIHDYGKTEESQSVCGCPGGKTMVFGPKENAGFKVDSSQIALQSELRQWPVQLHLINPEAPYFKGADVLIAADCTAYALGDFHQKHLRGKSLVIACPKLDSNTTIYIEKIKKMIDESKVNTLTVMMMEVPCCGGLMQMVRTALDQAERKVPIKSVIVGIQGEILTEEWV